MTVFKRYSAVYDLLYKDKDYVKEALHISEIFQKYGVNQGSSILNLGCGTGKHDHILAKMGYKMTGVDMSEEMVEIAREVTSHPSPTFLQSDIRTLNLGTTFQAVISMFHVMSYQNTNDDVEAVFKTAFDHLEKGGIFLFDCWYGPAVISEKPEKRERIVENDEMKVIRRATPELKEKENIVVVNYDFEIIDKLTGRIDKFSEKHSMRYFFVPEIKLFCENRGFELISAENNGWNLEVVGRK